MSRNNSLARELIFYSFINTLGNKRVRLSPDYFYEGINIAYWYILFIVSPVKIVLSAMI